MEEDRKTPSVPRVGGGRVVLSRGGNSPSKVPKVLWISRHEPLAEQLHALCTKLGNFRLIKVPHGIPNAEWVIQNFPDVDYIIPVLPLSMVARLVELAKERGITVLWAEMEQVKVLDREPVPFEDYNPQKDAVLAAREPDGRRTWKVMRFRAFHVIRGVRIELERW